MCPIPPNSVTNGVVNARSTGNKFGVVCLGTDSVEFVAVPSCSMLSVKYDNTDFYEGTNCNYAGTRK